MNRFGTKVVELCDARYVSGANLQSRSNSLDSSVQKKKRPLNSCTATTAKMNIKSM